jgi:hypothetical protein
MTRSSRFTVAALVACVLLLALSAWMRSWGGVALVVLGAAGAVWYRNQVARSEAGEAFFGDMGEETRLTGFQPGAPSEMPLDRTIPPQAAAAPAPEDRPPA